MRLRQKKAPAAVALSAAARRDLQRLSVANEATPRVRLRALILLLSAAGQSGDAIATTLGITRRSVTDARTRWRVHGREGLLDAPRDGRPRRADAAYIARLLAVVEHDPRDYGYVFARWTAPRLAAYLGEVTGVQLSEKRVAALLRAHDVVWRRTKRTIRNLQDPAAVAHAASHLGRLKRGRTRMTAGTSSGSATG
jgi:transposase